jgi:predicted transcriptional regulator
VVVRTQKRGELARRRILILFQQRRRAQPTKPPTIREYAKAIGLSVAATHRHVRILRDQGVLDYDRDGR